MTENFPPERRRTKSIRVGDVQIGNGAPITVQSMTNTKTANVDATVKQILELQDVGCEIVRVAVPDRDSAEAIPEIKKQISIPLVADIHFNYHLALAAIEAGCDKIRINPGNIGDIKRVEKVINSAREAEIPIRIGVNSGSLEPELLKKYGYPSAAALAESALNHIELFEKLNFYNMIISIKASDLPRTVEANRMLAEKCEYPIHLGVTESGGELEGAVKSAAALGLLLNEGIGDTIRISLTADPVKEVKAAFDLLRAFKIRNVGIEIISCPTCGRAEVDVEKIAEEIREKTKNLLFPLKVAVMGCVVNGPGEAREADIGLAGGKEQFLLFTRGKIVKKIDQSSAVDELIKMIHGMIK